MKKLLVVMGLAMAAFSFQASAATLNWSNISGVVNPVVVDTTPSSLFGSENFLANNFNVNANWEFILSSLSRVLINVSSLKVNPTWLKHVELDGNALTQLGGPTNGAWLFDSVLGAGSHTIHLDGKTNGRNSGYQLNVAQTPIPAAVWLFGSALMGLMGISRRKSA
jgi:hypothetical protein